MSAAVLAKPPTDIEIIIISVVTAVVVVVLVILAVALCCYVYRFGIPCRKRRESPTGKNSYHTVYSSRT